MGGSFARFVACRLGVFTGLSGTGGQPLYDVAADYVVTTFWHFDLGASPAYYGGSVNAVLWMSLPAGRRRRDLVPAVLVRLLGAGLHRPGHRLRARAAVSSRR